MSRSGPWVPMSYPRGCVRLRLSVKKCGCRLGGRKRTRRPRIRRPARNIERVPGRGLGKPNDASMSSSSKVELSGAIEQPGDAGHAVGTVQRDLERPHRIPAELEAEREVHDALVVTLGIETLDLAEVVEAPHGLRLYRGVAGA